MAATSASSVFSVAAAAASAGLPSSSAAPPCVPASVASASTAAARERRAGIVAGVERLLVLVDRVERERDVTDGIDALLGRGEKLGGRARPREQHEQQQQQLEQQLAVEREAVAGRVLEVLVHRVHDGADAARVDERARASSPTIASARSALAVLAPTRARQPERWSVATSGGTSDGLPSWGPPRAPSSSC